MELSYVSHKKSITLPTPTWKMYENPLYTTNNHNTQEEHDPHPPFASSSAGIINNNNNNNNNNNTGTAPSTNHHHPAAVQPVLPKIHILHLPISARKIAASFWDLSTFMKVRPVMESTQLKMVDQVVKEEVEVERRWRKKLESHNKKLGRELSEERKRREAVERVCAQLAGEVSEEICRFKMEMEEERKMMRMADLFREERVRIKLAEARFLMEEEKLIIDREFWTQKKKKKKKRVVGGGLMMMML
ncbi:calponin homology domain-containing protein DDB_G0272472-like [Impatiens glandulifera]|uniref:calponin homology domain-containing protein DDB_G0272472-like n=1 Tax=Impatiens glandulifera TaxID=253017 RepID=UPI001FB08DD7|nr:calponin homology domain-containing protein DDB_G0272472-like [Impatiens glandulifera]